jgi:GGDEF domain-containing protein
MKSFRSRSRGRDRASGLDGHLYRAWEATQVPAQFATRQLGDQLLAAALVGAACAAAFPQHLSSRAAMLAIAAASLALGAALRFSKASGTTALDRGITATVLLVGATCFVVRDVPLVPMLLLWPLLLSAHFAVPSRFAVNVGLALITYAAGAIAVNPGGPASGYVLFAVCTVGPAMAYRRVRTKVADMFIRIEELSSRDPITGALSPQAFDRARRAWIGHGQQRKLDTSLAVIQLDNLASFPIGPERDEVFRHLARVAFTCIRETDAFGRVGKIRFGLLFPGTPADDAQVAAERLVRSVERGAAQSGLKYTVSIGLASDHAHTDPWTAALIALDDARARGGNRIALATPTRPSLVEAPKVVDDGDLADAA